MHKLIKLIGKIVFTLVVLLMVFKLAQLTLKEQVKIENKEIKKFEVSQEAIISSGQEIVIKSFSVINDVKWINNDHLLIEGVVDKKKSKYIFDTLNNELLTYTEKDTAVLDYGNLEFIREIPEVGALCIKGPSIGLLKDGVFNTITENATYEGDLKFALSDDLTKLVYYHNEKGNVVTYSFEKDFYRSINANLDNGTKENFSELVKISPLGGYVSVEHRDDVLDESYFSIYGADSGKLYADKVYGIYLSWSDLDEYVCYYYTNESQFLPKGSINGMSISSNRIGYYDVSNKDIKFIDSSASKIGMLSKIYWSGNTITTLKGTTENNIQFKTIESYDFETKSFNEWELDVDPIMFGSVVELLDYDNEFILFIESDEVHQVLRIVKDTREVTRYDGLLPFDTQKEEAIYFYSAEGTFITMDYEKMTVSDEGFQGYITIPDTSFTTLPNDEMNRIVVWLTNKAELKILKTN